MNIITHSKTLKILIYNDKRKNDKYLINNNFINRRKHVLLPNNQIQNIYK